jgi:hypothetical protein
MANTSNQCKTETEPRRENQPRTGTTEAVRGRMESHKGSSEDLSSTLTQKAGDAWETT